MDWKTARVNIIVNRDDSPAECFFCGNDKNLIEVGLRDSDGLIDYDYACLECVSKPENQR